MSGDLIQQTIFFSTLILFTALIVIFKLKKKELETRGTSAELAAEVDALRDDLTDMQDHTRIQLAEMQERLDFAERLLAAGRESQENKSG